MVAEDWIDLVIRRAKDLQRAGILSIGCDGHSASLAPYQADPDAPVKDEPQVADESEPVNQWENPASYPTGQVPSFDVDRDLPPIPSFGDG